MFVNLPSTICKLCDTFDINCLKCTEINKCLECKVNKFMKLNEVVCLDTCPESSGYIT